MSNKVTLTIGDVVFLLDTFKVLNNAVSRSLSPESYVEVEDLILECEELLNKAAEGDTDEGLTEFREAIKTIDWTANTD